MDQVLNKVGSYWFSRKANKEISSVGDDFNVRNLWTVRVLMEVSS